MTLYDVCNDYSLCSDTDATVEDVKKSPAYSWRNGVLALEDGDGCNGESIEVGRNVHDEIVYLIGPEGLDGVQI